MKLLYTGFEPFGGESINPSAEAVKLLPECIDGCEIAKLILPVSFKAAPAILTDAIHSLSPDAVICVGQAGGRQCITVERIAINLADASMPDNDGIQPADSPLYENAPTAYFSMLPVKKIVEALRASGIPAALSYSAGAFVCNAVMYSALHCIAMNNLQIAAGFIHLPYLPQQGEPSMTLTAMTDGLCAIAKSMKGNFLYIRHINSQCRHI